MKLIVDTTEATDLSDNQRFRDPNPAEILEAARPHADLSWIEKIMVLDAVDKVPVEATLDNSGWKLLHVGSGKGGQTTLTFGWPAHAALGADDES